MLTKVIAIITLLTVLAAAWLLPGVSSYPSIPDELVFQRIDGLKQAFRDFRGKPLLVTFWSPGCVICMHEVDEFNQLYRNNNGGQDFELLGLSMFYDRPDHVLQSSARQGMLYPVYLDLQRELSRSFGNITITPTSFLLNDEGDIVYRQTGKLDFPHIQQKLNELMG